ncbi:MAG: alpha/beta hydrolase [Alphaproteobacteria bacterium]|nr:alpha/beta hydrolase [Alphaproteobacteria bacterium]
MAEGRIDRRGAMTSGLALGAAVLTGAALGAERANTNPTASVPMPAQVPAKRGIAELPGTRLEYWDTGGDGQAVVLLHPATGSTAIWGYQQPVFARVGYRVIAYSRRGYSTSDSVPADNPGTAADDLRNLLRFLGVRKCHLVGSAAGGGVAIDYALSYASDLYSLVMACAVGGVTNPDWAAMVARIRPRGFDEFPVEFRELSQSYRAANPEGTRDWLALVQKSVTSNRFGQMPANAVTWAKLEALKIPVLLIGGDADLYLPPPMLKLYASHIPASETAIFAEGGHSLYWEQPDLFNRTVLAFLAKHR